MAASNNFSENSLINLPAPRPILVETQSLIVAFTETGTQKFKKSLVKQTTTKKHLISRKKNLEYVWNSDLGMYLQSAATLDQYKIACYYFRACFALVACKFSVDELNTIFDAIILSFILEKSEINQKNAQKYLNTFTTEYKTGWSKNSAPMQSCGWSQKGKRNIRSKRFMLHK